MDFRLQISDFRVQTPLVNTGEVVARSRASRLATRNAAPRRAISLIEVLISMFVLLFGLMGVAAIFPVGNHFVVEGEKFDLGSALAQNAFEELKGRGLLRPEAWHYSDPQQVLWNRHTATTGGSVDNEDLVIQPSPLGQTGPPNPNRGLFNMTLPSNRPFGPGHAFVIDPMGAASGTSEDFLFAFPYSHLGTPDYVNPWFTTAAADQNTSSGSLPLSGFAFPARRVTVADIQVPMRTEVAETICRLRDDLAVEQPDASDVPSRQLWQTFDANPAGTASDLDDTSDDVLLSRQYKGDYSWLATVVPTSSRGLQALQPASEDYGEIACDVSVVVFRKRAIVPFEANEIRTNAKLLPGGELIVYAPNTRDGKNALDETLKEIRPGNWIVLMGVNQTSGEFLMKWYRLLSLDDQSQQLGIFVDYNNNEQQVWLRRAMLSGPDWPANSTLDLRAGFFPGAISVVTKPIRMEHSSLWSIE